MADENKKKNFFMTFLSKIGGDEGNVIRYRFVFAACFVIHAFFAILFTCVNVNELAVFNYFSSAMYMSGFILLRTNKHTRLWFYLMYFEIVTHGILCGIFVGYDYQFTLYSLAIISVAYFVTFLDPAFAHPLLESSFAAAINVTAMILLQYFSIDFVPKYNAFPKRFINMVERINLIAAIMIMLSFSIMFTAKINYDIKTLKKQNDKLDFLANYDQLTGLRNRNHIADIFGQYIKSTDPYCVILGDIDDFKHVNDTYGHNAGDEVLKKVSSIIKESVGNRGEVCRWGGEEILILLKGTTEDCLALNERILNEIRNTTVESGKYRIKITMTFGLCDYGDAMNIEKLISLADKRLYIGKKSGKNRIVSVS